jgi:hypothetical protein
MLVFFFVSSCQFSLERRESARRKDSQCQYEDQTGRRVYVPCHGPSLSKTLVSGQAYEKKAKKNAVDAAEEHNRYVNLLNTLGPEISQIK